ncbi:MAG TPA: septum formation initiator family protein [Candidatus Saccharimonadales bacterium]
MQTKKQYIDLVSHFLRRMNDTRFVGQVIFVIIVLLITWSGVKTIQTNYNLQKQVATIKQQDAVRKLQNDNLALQNQYLNSNQYLELSARQNFGLAAPGEQELIVPKAVALAYTVKLPGSAPDAAKAAQPAYQRNFQSWVDFFLHRQDASASN